ASTSTSLSARGVTALRSRMPAAGAVSGSGAFSRRSTSRMPAPWRPVSQPAGAWTPEVISTSLNTAGSCAAPYRLTSAALSWNASHSAHAPAVVATANDVPEPTATPSSSLPVLRPVRATHTDSPGAVTSTAGPLADRSHIARVQLHAAHAITESNRAGYTTNGQTLPAAASTTIPLATARSIARSRARDLTGPPRLMEMTWQPLSTA